MAIYRNIHLSFWTDNKVEDDFTPEDKYFYLYLMTNPQTNICGCYEVSYSQMSFQTGYNKETICRLLERFENIHKVIKYDPDTKEVLIINWHKYNWSKSPKTLSGVEKVASHIKSTEFRYYVLSIVEQLRENEVLCANLDSSPGKEADCKKIIDFLNDMCGTRYRFDDKNTHNIVLSKINEGYSIDDFYTVIRKKYDEWRGTKMEPFLRPETLFRDKFETYLRQKNVAPTKNKNKFNNFPQRRYDMKELEALALSSRNN